MLNSILVFVLLFSYSCSSSVNDAPPIVLAEKGKSDYVIIISDDASASEKKAAQIFQTNFKKVTGASLQIKSESAFKALNEKAIFIGKTYASEKVFNKPIKNEGFFIASKNKNIFIKGNAGQSNIYGVYSFSEQFLKMRKYDEGEPYYTQIDLLKFPSNYFKKEEPSFIYREAYYPFSFNDEYLQWHKMHRLEDLWGIWGHSYFKLVPPQKYFKSHPEFYSLVDGKRQPLQLCLSNKMLEEVVVKELKDQMKKKDWAEYWSISANDDIGFCTCNECSKIDAEEGSNAGTLIHFVNRIASHFPDKKFTTLAYQQTAKPPKNIKPAKNVIVMLSTIDAYRSKSLQDEPSAKSFNDFLKGWQKLTDRIFIWDYSTQFTNYLAPFPQLNVFSPNINWFVKNNVTGIFTQGSGDTYSDFSELYTYVLAKLSWNESVNVDSLVKQFCTDYYKNGATAVLEYIKKRQQETNRSKKPLDIYGNPVNDYDGYLSPENIDVYSSLLDKAEAATEEQPDAYKKVRRLRLGLEYTVLQQSRFFGQEKFGFELKNADGSVTVKPNWPLRVERFTKAMKEAGIKYLNEAETTPEQYDKQWKEIFKTPHKFNLAYNAKVDLLYPFAEEYPAKRERTLVDEVPGYDDFSYNWLLFYGVDLSASIELKEAKKINSITVHFLKDARHWIFLPKKFSVWTSENGNDYKLAGSVDIPLQNVEDFSVERIPFQIKVNASHPVKFIKVEAENIPSLPLWRTKKNRKPSIACDEIYVN